MSLPEESRGFVFHSYLKNQITKVGIASDTQNVLLSSIEFL